VQQAVAPPAGGASKPVAVQEAAAAKPEAAKPAAAAMPPSEPVAAVEEKPPAEDSPQEAAEDAPLFAQAPVAPKEVVDSSVAKSAPIPARAGAVAPATEPDAPRSTTGATAAEGDSEDAPAGDA